MAVNKYVSPSDKDSFFDWIANAPIPMMLHSEDGEVLRINKAWINSTGYTREDIPTIDIWMDKSLASNNEETKAIIRSLFDLGDGRHVGEFSNTAKDGHKQIWDFYSYFIGLWDNGRKAVLSIGIDITERYKLQNALLKKSTFMQTTLASVVDGVISTDQTGNIRLMNRAAEFLTGWSEEDAVSKPVSKVFVLADKHTGKRIKNVVQEVLDSKKTLELGRHAILVSKNGRERLIEDTISPIIQENGDMVGAVIVFRDYSDKQRRENEIRYLSYNDQLTGLYNRRFYEEELHRLDTQRNYPLSLVMADVNGLKLTNDAFGHAAGDNLLKKIAGILKNQCRTDDILARIGGDEFVILLPKTDEYQARKLISRISEALKKEKSEKVMLSISVGAAEKKDSSVSMHEVFKKAEDEMYRNKLTDSTSLKSQTIVLILNALYENNRQEMERSKRVGELCEEIAAAMHLEKSTVNQTRTAGILHDIGNIGIDESILEKPQKLDENEWYEVKKHPEIGYHILSSVNEFSDVAGVVLQHQERWDGKGYPKALAGEQISVPARIVSIAAAYDAMISERPYINAVSEQEAAEEIKKSSGVQFDPQIARVFIENVLQEKW